MEEKIKTRQGSGYLKQLYSTARVGADTTHSGLKGMTTFLVNFIPVEKVDASELQVRTHFNDEEITALAHSIKEHGVLQPILVVQDGDRYKVIAGERRLRASKEAGIERIPARVLNSTDKAIHEIALRENLDRVDLHPIEEGEGYVSLLESQAYTSHESIAKSFGKPKSRITECIGYTRLPQDTKNSVLQEGVKSRALMRQLLTAPVEEHIALIAEAKKKEGLEAALVVKATNTTEKKAKPSQEKTFEYKASAKKVKVPGFSWKVGEGESRLKSYAEQLRQLLKDIEKIID